MKSFLIKLTIGSILFGFLIHQNLVDFSILFNFIKQNDQLSLIILFIFLTDILMTAFRWKIVLNSFKNNKLSFRDCFSLTWMGMFFNSILPGIIIGDGVKFFKSLKDSNLTKKELSYSIFIDRAIGLYTLLFIGALASFLSNLDNLYIYLNYFIFFSFTLILLFFKKFITNNTALIIKGFLISLYTQGINSIIFYLILKTFVFVNLTETFTLFSLASTSLDIPLTPSGMGVSHLFFEILFQHFNLALGANIFNIYFSFYTFINLLGFFIYLLRRK